MEIGIALVIGLLIGGGLVAAVATAILVAGEDRTGILHVGDL